MKADTFLIGAIIPSKDDFAGRFPQYRKFANSQGRGLFDRIMTAETLVFMQVVTISLGLPAVAGIAKFCFEFVKRCDEVEWDAFTKQFIGAVVCTLMEANGFEKAGRKAVPLECFAKAIVYKVAR